jgi:hypothetical protein
VGARIIADDTVEAQSGLDRRAFGDGRQTPLIIVQATCVPCREFRDLSFCVAATDLQKASGAQRKEVRDRAVDDPQSMHGKIEVANDFRVQ